MNVIHLELEGKQYDSLYLRIAFEFPKREFIKGYSKNGYNWVFSYPDSLYDYIEDFIIWVSGTPDSVRQSLRFNLVLHGDTMVAENVHFGRPVSFVKARYMKTAEPFKGRMVKRGTENQDFPESITGSFIVDHFEVFTDDEQLVSSMKHFHHGYGYFPYRHPKTVGLTYEEVLRRDMEFIKQYPNSRGMMVSLYGNMSLYRSKADITEVFNLFTEEIQQSFYGQKVYQHITRFDTVFKNQKLSTWDTDMPELIVQDSSKYNLILFSTSWCGPCIRQIPMLKEIHQDLGQNLVMTYVSMDDERSVEAWQEKMRAQKIPWRSLMVLTKAKGQAIENDYETLGSVPYTLLVHPYTMKKERLDLREEADRQRLYELVNNL